MILKNKYNGKIYVILFADKSSLIIFAILQNFKIYI